MLQPELAVGVRLIAAAVARLIQTSLLFIFAQVFFVLLEQLALRRNVRLNRNRRWWFGDLLNGLSDRRQLFSEQKTGKHPAGQRDGEKA